MRSGLAAQGRGDKIQRISRACRHGPSVVEGRHPAIALSHAATLRLEGCTFNDNWGAPLQWADPHEQAGTTGLDERTAAEARAAAEELVSSRLATVEEMRERMPPAQIAMMEQMMGTSGVAGSPARREAEVQAEVAKAEAQAAEAAVMRVRGSVESARCRCANNALSRYLPSEPPSSGTVPVRPWFAEGTPMFNLHDEDGHAAPLAGGADDDEQRLQDASAWHACQKPMRFGGGFFGGMEEGVRAGSRLSGKDPMKEWRARISAPAAAFYVLADDGAATEALGALPSATNAFETPRKLFMAEREAAEAAAGVKGGKKRKGGSSFSASDMRAGVLKRREAKQAFTDLSEPESEALRQRTAAAFAELRATIRARCAALLEAGDVRGASSICWGAAQSVLDQGRLLSALFGAVALATEDEGSVTAGRAEVLVGRLECDDMAQPVNKREYLDACACDSAGMAAAQLAIQLLGETHAAPITGALLRMLGDRDNSSAHGRRNAAQMLAQLAQRCPEQRLPAIEAIAATIKEEEGDGRGLSAFSRGCLLGDLIDLRASECAVAVRSAFKKGLVDESVCGGFTDYLVAVGIKVDVDDRVVKEQLENPSVWRMKGDSEGEVAQRADARRDRLAAEVAAHNDQLATEAPQAPGTEAACAHCGARPSRGDKPFKCCSGCRAVFYCGSDCQKAAWKGGHKRVCKSREKKKAAWETETPAPAPARTLPLVEQWLAEPHPKWLTMHRGAPVPAREKMSKLGIDEPFLQGLAVGDWDAAQERLHLCMKQVQVQNSPPLRAGDRVEVTAGNHVKWESVGQRGTLAEYFSDCKKWGIEMDDGEPVLILQGNLRRSV